MASDVGDFLSHIAWTDVLRPKFAAYKELLIQQLTSSVLGMPVTAKTFGGNEVVISKEQIAGRIAGIDWLVQTLERILKEGDRAASFLESNGFHQQ